MKVCVHGKGIILSGKAWEILRKLKEYNQEFETVLDWVQSVSKK